MRRFIVALLVAAALLGTGAWAALAAEVAVSQPFGTQDDVFVFRGEGFEPGTEFVVLVLTPDSLEFPLHQNGRPAVVVADDNGAFTLEVVPGQDLAGMPDGLFHFGFVDLGTGDRYTTTIEIAPPPTIV